MERFVLAADRIGRSRNRKVQTHRHYGKTDGVACWERVVGTSREGAGFVERVPLLVHPLSTRMRAVSGCLERWRKEKPYTAEILNSRVAVIAGTSSCHMAISRDPRFIPGVWGPYFSAMIPDLWLTEAGQSATGAVIDHIIYTHGVYPEAKKASGFRRSLNLRFSQ